MRHSTVGNVPDAAPRPPWVGFWRRWWLFTTTAEFVGFGVPALAGIAAWQTGLSPVSFYLAMVAAGAVEGAILGVGQQQALKRAIPAIGAGWPVSTSAGAAIAWSIGMLPSTLIDLGVAVWLALALFVPLAPLLLMSIGVAQWTVLRHHLPRAWLWIPVNAVAWLVALPPTFVAPALVPEGASIALHVVAWLTAGLIMASIVAALTGWTMAYLLKRHARVLQRQRRQVDETVS
jgi:hypothetical protein